MSDITNSIKAKLYDFTYTPFMSSMIISWIILNHKYLLIYFGDSKLDEKLTLLNEYDFSWHTSKFDLPYTMNVWFPIIFGLFYVFVYPWASKIFYEYTLERTKALKKVKQKIEDETPITQEEARQIRQDITRLSIERDELREKALNTEKYYKEEYRKKVQELSNKEWDIEADSKPDDTDKKDTLSSKKAQTPILHADIPSIPKESDTKKILRFFYESNYKSVGESNTLDFIVKQTQIPRPKAQKILNDLISKGTLAREDKGYKFVSITPKGNSELIDMFDKEEKE